VDNTGLGDGNSLDAPDGAPQDAIYVDNDGRVIVNSPTPSPQGRLQITPPHGTVALRIDSDSQSISFPAVVATCDSSSAIVGNATKDAFVYAVPTTPAGVAGIATGDWDGGFFQAYGNGTGAACWSGGAGSAVYGNAMGSGYSGEFEGGLGVSIERGSSYPVLEVRNTATTGWGDAGWFLSPSGMNSGTWAIDAECYEGNAGRFLKSTDDADYALLALGAGGTGEALYVAGASHFTIPPSTATSTSRGTEAVFTVTAPDVEIMTSGTASLAGGTARVQFDRLFAESVSDAVALRVTATPVGAWSALYLTLVDGGGFTVRSDAGDANASFNWVAVGRAKGYGERPAVSIPDPTEDARIAAEKKATVEAARPPARDTGPAVMSVPAEE
jgi:hypothetical protein